jgi:hypothetical protein
MRPKNVGLTGLLPGCSIAGIAAHAKEGNFMARAQAQARPAGSRARRAPAATKAATKAATQANEAAAADPAPAVPAGKAAGSRSPWNKVARPDALDVRDRPFHPNVAVAPQPSWFPEVPLPVKDQGDTNACTGFGLALVVEHLLHAAGREAQAISPFMLYSMARRYDEFPGSVEDEGSSARGALKGWFKHGACREELFPEREMPAAKPKSQMQDDWWFDAVRRPLGAYYRIAPRNIVDMHCALNEVGILYVTCGCHSGWDLGVGMSAPRARRPRSFKDKVWVIPRQGGHAAHPGHAFAIVGYNDCGFLIQNSWGPTWGSGGYAILTYNDWIDNAMDCWVAQLGVVTTEHEDLAKSVTLRQDAADKVKLAGSRVLRNREIAPFIINMGNNGKLSNSGTFRTTPDDVRAIVDVHLQEARVRWGLKGKPMDVCIYAHGGLVDEDKAADTAAQWIPLLYDQKIFPVFLMWETGFMTTLLNMVEDALRGVPRPAGGARDGLERWWNQRLERLLARPGHLFWAEMKQNAQALSAWNPEVAVEQQTGAVLLYQHFRRQVTDQQVRLHFVGHSAGAIVLAWMLDRLHEQGGMSFESMSLMAPALRVDEFNRRVRPHLQSGALKRYQQFHLSDRAEEDDHTCGPYRRSLLYLVSESFEAGNTVPILGMQRHWDAEVAPAALPAVAHVAPGPASQAGSHAAFDDDPVTQQRIIDFVLGG